MFSATALRIQLRKAVGPLVAEELAVHLQQVGPLVRPVFDVIAAADQLVDQLVALHLRRPRVGEERAHVVRLRRQAGQVEVDAADEVGVGAEVARQHLHAS